MPGPRQTSARAAETVGRARSRTRVIAFIAVACAALGLWIAFRGRPRIPEPTAHAAAKSEAPGYVGAGAPTPFPSPPRAGADGDDKLDPKSLWEKRLARAKKTLDTYLEATRYPPGSRPMNEHPDLRAPHHVEPASLPLARKDHTVTDARVSLHQDRFYMVGDEVVALEIDCSNSDGPVPCEVTSARTTVPPSEAKGSPPPEVDVPFSSVPQGVALASFQPSKQGYAGYHGTIRIAVELGVRTESGSASFDIQYTPSAPATFTGKVREALASGSLDFFVEADVVTPGRYMISGRVDDRNGQTFAYVSFNDVVPAGRREIGLRVFGKLIRDQGASSPFRLRDVEGYLLKENTYPDRELMASLDGVVLTSRTYDMRNFSTDAWDSDDKKRHVAEFTRDVNDAQGHVDETQP